MTNPSERQRASTYPANFILARLPGELAPYDCDHEVGECFCAHDWRIYWGNKPKVSKVRNTYVTS